jgi:hypothetical protein
MSWLTALRVLAKLYPRPSSWGGPQAVEEIEEITMVVWDQHLRHFGVLVIFEPPEMSQFFACWVDLVDRGLLPTSESGQVQWLASATSGG